MDSTTLKTLHISSVALSYTLFFLRGIWMLRASPILQQRWIKVAPHLIDSVLLGSAILLAWRLAYSPLEHPWLAAKIIALLLYIIVGSVALKRGRTRTIRLGAWWLAQLIFAYIVSVAVTKTPLPWLY